MYIVNTADGEIVNEEHLIEALENGTVAGYGTDVLAGEMHFDESFDNYPLVEYAKTHQNVIIVPHLGGMTYESREATDVFMAEKLLKHIKQSS
jgi:D-3-phosphoglycerate dehydrogenase